MLNDGFYGTNIFGLDGVLGADFRYHDEFRSLPEDIQEQVNAHAQEFRNADDIRRFISELRKRQ